MNKKKILLIILVVLIFVIALALIWYFFIREEPQPPVLSTEEEKQQNYEIITSNTIESLETEDIEVEPDLMADLFPKEPQTPTIDNPKFISESLVNNVLTPFLLNNGRSIYYYNLSDSGLYEYNIRSKQSSILNRLRAFQGINEFKWNETTNSRVIIYDLIYSPDNTTVLEDPELDKATIKKYIYDVDSNSFNELSERIQDVAWLGGDEIIYYYYDEENNINTLSKADYDQSNFENLFELNQVPYPDMFDIVGVYNNQVYYSYYLDQNSKYVLEKYDLSTQKNTRLMNNLVDSKSFVFSDDGSKFLTNIYNNENNQELVLSYTSNNFQENPEINSSVYEIAWANDNETFYYAEGENVDFAADGSLNYKTTDSFWKYNTASGAKTQLTNLNTAEGIDARDLSVTPEQERIYFLNTRNYTLHYLDLN